MAVGKKKGKLGGARPGAGRPKGKVSLEKEQARLIIREKVFENLGPMLEAHIKHAKGISYLVYREKKGGKFTKVTAENAQSLFELAELPGSEGGVIIEAWEKEPSVQSFTDLLNRAVDKPAEQEQNINLKLPGMEAILARLEQGRKRVSGAKRS